MADALLTAEQNVTSRLLDLGFVKPRLLSKNHWAALTMFGSFVAIVDGTVDDIGAGYKNRWIFTTALDADDALALWDGNGSPAVHHTRLK